METMINLTDLLKHEILDLYSVEEQIIEAMPPMIEKAKNPELKRALREHLKITEEQKMRLDKLKATFGSDDEEGGQEGEKKGFFSRLFGGSGGEKCKGMEGIISEGEKMMGADIAEDTLDAVIIACAQKIEHYEICGYGTARAYAIELKLPEAVRLLTQSRDEEYTADRMLTELAVGKLNIEAENATGMTEDEGGRGSNSSSSKKGGSKGNNAKGNNSKSSSKAGSSKTSSKGKSSTGGSSKGSTSPNSNAKNGSSKSGSSSKGGSSKSGSSSKGSSSKGGSSKGSSSKGGSSKSSSKSSGNKSGKSSSNRSGSRGR